MKLFVRRRATEALLDGSSLQHDSGLEDVEAFLADMRLEFGALPAPEPRPTLASTLDGRRPLRPATPRPKPTFPPARPRSQRLRPVVAVLATSTVLFGGLAGAGALPGPVQRSTAGLTSHLGLQLPGAGVEPGPTHSSGSRTTTSRPRTSPTTNPTTGTTGTGAGASVAPTTSASPSTSVPTGASTVPTAPRVAVPQPKVSVPASAREGLIGKARRSAPVPNVLNP
jgi:hypothetical protein